MSMKSSCGGDDAELRRGPWTLQEDTLLVHYIASFGEGNWNVLAKRSGLKRTGKSCRLRWLNYLKPDVKRGNLSPQEQLLILQLHSRWGNRWSKIAQELPGRTDNEIKNYWRTRIHKQARLLNMDTNSTAFQDTIRYFWIPRLLEKIQHSSPPSPDPSPILSPNPILDPDPASNHFEYQVHSDQSTSSSVTCSDSVNMFQVTNVSDGSYTTTTTPFQSLESCYQAMECNNIENYENPIQSCDGFGDDGLWGLDELWQFR